METPNIIAATLERKLSLEGSESEILVDAKPKEQKVAAEASDSGNDIAVPPFPTAVPSATAATPSTGWNWNPFSFLYPATPTPPTDEEQRRIEQQIQERQTLEAAVAKAQEDEKNDFDFVSVEAHLLPMTTIAQQLAEQQEATKILEEQQLQKEQELKAQQEAEALEKERLQLEQDQELKTQQEAIMTTPSNIWNLYGLLGSPTPEAPSTQTEPDLTEIVPDDPTNASNIPTANIPAEEVNFVFRPSADPIGPHPAAAFAVQTDAEEARAIQQATNQSTRDLATNEAFPAGTQPAETKEENETAVFDAAEETDQAEAQRMEVEALETAQRLAEEQARAREEQARIEREERARQDAILLQQQMLLQRQLEQQRLEQERQRAAEAKAAEEKEAAEIAFSKYCSTGERTLEAHDSTLRAAILEGGF